MRNLAGDPLCDAYICEELNKAGVPIVPSPRPGKDEVPACIAGELGEFTFRRAWYYWVVSGKVSLKAAEEMYADPNGRKDVRVAGHCGCPPPKDWVEWYDKTTHRQILDMGQKAEFLRYADSNSESLRKTAEIGLRDYYFAEDPSLVGEGFVTLYHIDTQEGLNLFVQTIKAHHLV